MRSNQEKKFPPQADLPLARKSRRLSKIQQKLLEFLKRLKVKQVCCGGGCLRAIINYIKLSLKFVYTIFLRKAVFSRLPRRKFTFLRGLFVFILAFSWIFSGWPQIWQNPSIPPEIEEVQALNKVNNWNFATDASGWTATNDNGSNVCGDNNSSTGDTAYSTFGYNSGTFRAVTAATKNSNYRGKISQSITAPGSGNVKVKGKITYTSSGTSWGSSNTSWIRLDLYDSSDTNHVGNLFCLSFNSNQSATSAFGSEVSLTGGTTYTIRVTMRNRVGSSNAAITTTVDNIVVNFAPVGLSVSAVAGSTNVSLSWTASTAGSGANGLHATTPYKVYRDTSSPVSTFLANSTTNSYTDSSTAGNTTYYYAVSDVDTASDESPLSAEASVLTNPSAPTALNFTNVQSTSLRVNWTAPTGGASSYKVERCSGSGCSSFSEIASGVTNTYYDDSSLICNTLYRYQVRATNASGDGAYSSIAEQTTGICGSITADIVNASYVSVGSPTMAMNVATFSFTCQTVTGSFGTASQQIYVNNNNGANNGWTLTVAAQATTNVWDSVGTDYDFNDPTGSGCTDGGDTDLLGGQMTVNPSVATLAVGQCGSCSTANVSKGSSSAFNEGTTDTITLLTATAASDDVGDWTLQGVSISQKIPAEQPVASDYDINIVLTVTAN